MYRKTVWCYIFVLTLLDIALNTKLTAQGKSHDVTTVHDSLLEGITFQEWGGAETSGGAGGPVEALQLRPRALRFGRVPLAVAHRLTVTLTNLANTTVHLASVAGTTGDFHASFFESKTLPPQGNTTFSVVYLGRREGPVSANLYLHTSLGVHKYLVSAEGVASEWGVWPLVGLRVPANATLEPLLTLYNPTDQPVQVSEVYSSGGWVSLQLPEGGAAAARDAWRVPPRQARALVRLTLRLPAPPARPRAAYVRIKGDMVGGSGGGLVVAVEAVAAPAGPYMLPPQLRLRLRGSGDPPDTWDVSAGNSGATPAAVDAVLWGARCAGVVEPAPPPPPPPPHQRHVNGAGAGVSGPAGAGPGAGAAGASLTVLRPRLAPHQEPVRAMTLTLDYARLWSSWGGGGGGAGGAGDAGGGVDGDGEGGAWCAGWVVWGAAAVPYSVRLLPGTLALLPPDLDIVTAAGEEAMQERVVYARNDLPVPVLVHQLEPGPGLLDYFTWWSAAPLVVHPGRRAAVARLRLRARTPRPPRLRSLLRVRTNLTDYTLPVTVHTGLLDAEWEWPGSAEGTLRLGAVGASSTRRLGVRLHNRGVRVLCARRLHARPPAASLTLPACASASASGSDSADHPCRCVEPGTWAQAWLTVVAPAREGPLEGSVTVATQHGELRTRLTLTVHKGRVQALLAPVAPAAPVAPYAGWSAAVVVESTMAVGMRALRLDPPPGAPADPAVHFQRAGEGWVSAGRARVGSVHYRAERACAPACYTGGHPRASTLAGRRAGERDLLDDLQLLRERRDMFHALPHRHLNISLYLQTTEVVQIPVSGSVELQWPRLAEAEAGAGGAAGALAAAGGAAPARLVVHNPAHGALLLHALVHAPRPPAPHPPHLPYLHPARTEALKAFCESESCVWSAEAFRLSEWRVVAGSVVDASDTGDNGDSGGKEFSLLLSPGSSVELTVMFTPATAEALAAYLYLRNNLTILEAVPLWGRGAHPSFEVGGRRAGASAPIVLEVSACSQGGAPAPWPLAVRNTGAVPVTLRDWRLAGAPCAARGFRLAPCAPLTLAPNESRPLALAFTADGTLARAAAPLTVRAHGASATFRLAAHAPPALLRACARAAPRPPFEPPLRAAGSLLAVVALALVLAAAALDAERALRRARAARPPFAPAPAPAPAARAPLDLRAVAAPPPAPPRRRRPARRPPPPAADARSPLAERRAFERWRARVLRRDPDLDLALSLDLATSAPPSVHDDDDSSPGPDNDDVAPGSSGVSDDAGRSGDSSVGSDSSPGDELEGRDDSDPDEHDPPTCEVPPPDACPRPPDEAAPRDTEPGRERPRREPGDGARRTERRTNDAESRARPPQARSLRRAGARRRAATERGGSPAPRPAAALEARAPAAVRWGASWSSVVAAGAAAGAAAGSGAGPGAPLPPIGSDVRRRAEASPVPMPGAGPGPGAGAGGDHSLFYFNGPRPAGYEWRSSPGPERDNSHDYLGEYAEDSSSLNSYGSVWAGGAWAWGGLPVRPPPGFGAPAAPAPRAYDPFRSLAAIWAPDALHWRPEPEAPAAPAAPGPPDTPKDE